MNLAGLREQERRCKQGKHFREQERGLAAELQRSGGWPGDAGGRAGLETAESRLRRCLRVPLSPL